MFKKACLAAALVGALASAHAEQYTFIDEGFANVPTLTSQGWKVLNPAGPGATQPWVQGDQTNFGARTGQPESYASSLWSDSAGGSLASWLLTSAFSTEFDTEVSFWARGGAVDGYFDELTYGLVNAAGDLSSLLPAATVTVLDDWTRYTFKIDAQGAGASARFALGHVGDPDTSNIVGVDDLRVAQVPEPSTWALAGVSLLGLMAARRRRAQR